MRFLVDENCDAGIVRALRQIGHDVIYVAEDAPGQSDDFILAWAVRDERVLMTEDRDFCELVFRDNKPTRGIVLIRISDEKRQEKIRRVVELVEEFGEKLFDSMTTLTSTLIRSRSLLDENTNPE